jgi:hypothetical protein
MFRKIVIAGAFGLIVATLAIAQTTPRFDHVVRGDFFAGVAGSETRLRRAMAACEQILAADPKHAEALVWHGSGLLVMSRSAFAAGNAPEGERLFNRGLKEMDDAVALEPRNVAVVIPRGSVLLQVSRFVPPAVAKPLIVKGVADYETALSIQAPYFASLGDHPRSELLFGLAEGYSRLGQPDRARPYFERIVNEVPKSGQAPRATEWLATGALPAISGVSCVGCHVPAGTR